MNYVLANLAYFWCLLTYVSRRNSAMVVRSSILEGRPISFTLYLRPFKFDDYAFQQKVSWHLAMCLWSKGPVIAISDVDLLGPSVLKSDDDTWKSDFEILAERATLIVLMPPFTDNPIFNKINSTPFGMSEEIAILKSPKLIHKTLCILPGRMLRKLRAGNRYWMLPQLAFVSSIYGISPLSRSSLRSLFDHKKGMLSYQPRPDLMKEYSTWANMFRQAIESTEELYNAAQSSLAKKSSVWVQKSPRSQFHCTECDSRTKSRSSAMLDDRTAFRCDVCGVWSERLERPFQGVLIALTIASPTVLFFAWFSKYLIEEVNLAFEFTLLVCFIPIVLVYMTIIMKGWNHLLNAKLWYWLYRYRSLEVKELSQLQGKQQVFNKHAL